LLAQVVDCVERAVCEILEPEVWPQKIATLSKTLKHALAVCLMKFAIVGVQVRQQQKLEAAEHVVLGELELLPDVGDLLVIEVVAKFESFHVEELVILDRLHRLEEAGLKNQI